MVFGSLFLVSLGLTFPACVWVYITYVSQLAWSHHLGQLLLCHRLLLTPCALDNVGRIVRDEHLSIGLDIYF